MGLNWKDGGGVCVQLAERLSQQNIEYDT